MKPNMMVYGLYDINTKESAYEMSLYTECMQVHEYF